MKGCYLFACFLIFTSALMAESDFSHDFALAKDAAAQSKVIQSHLKRELSLDAMREIQAAWQEIQPEKMQAYYDSLAAAYPQDMNYQYLSLRYRDAVHALLRLRLLLPKAPDFYWNIRLYAVSLCESYHSRGAHLTFTDADETLLKTALTHFPTDSYLKIALFYLYLAQGKSSIAGSYLAEIENAAVLAANWQAIESFLMTEKNVELFDALSARLWLDELSNGNISPEEYHYMQELAHDEFLKKLSAYEMHNPGALK